MWPDQILEGCFNQDKVFDFILKVWKPLHFLIQGVTLPRLTFLKNHTGSYVC